MDTDITDGGRGMRWKFENEADRSHNDLHNSKLRCIAGSHRHAPAVFKVRKAGGHEVRGGILQVVGGGNGSGVLWL